MCSQEPPVVVEAVASTSNWLPVLAAVTTCGSGFAPPNVFVKDSAGTVAKVWATATEVAAANSSVACKATNVCRKNRVDSMIPPRCRTPITCPRAPSGDSIPKGSSSPLVHACGQWTYYAVRKRAGKTVMRFRNTGTAHGFDPGELGATPEERRALDYLFSLTYEELPRLASSVKRRDPNSTLSPTTLVHEAWLKLANSPHLADTSRLHFKRIAARAMRQLLVEVSARCG